MQNKHFRKGRGIFSRGKISLISGIISSLGYFVIKDLEKENSFIKNTLKKIPYFNRITTNSNEKNYRIVGDSTITKEDEK